MDGQRGLKNVVAEENGDKQGIKRMPCKRKRETVARMKKLFACAFEQFTEMDVDVWSGKTLIKKSVE